MCYPKPGPRCASHTRQDMHKALERSAAAREARAVSPGDAAVEAEFNSARQAAYEAQVEYFATPSGQGVILERINVLESQGRDAETYWRMYETAVKHRRRQMIGRVVKELRECNASTQSDSPLIKGRKLALGSHAVDQAVLKGIDPQVIKDTYAHPEEVYPNRRYPGQVRVTGNGICLVCEERGGKMFVRTMYLDRVVTPPRADQLKDAAGKEFAAAYRASGGRNLAV